jgi:hypothetical protein
MNRFARISMGHMLLAVLVCLAGLLSVIAAPVRASEAPAAPVLVNVSDPATPDRFAVSGGGFTPGGSVYLAIYDQLGLKLYENRSVIATNSLSAYEASIQSYSRNNMSVPTQGGRIQETFAGLCNASALIRAFDQSSEQWTNWLTIQPNCGNQSSATVANDLNAPQRLPVATPKQSTPELVNDLNKSQDVVVGGPSLIAVGQSRGQQGSVTVVGRGFTPGHRVYIVVSDQRGAVLYPTRWSVAGFAQDAPDGISDMTHGYVEGGTVDETISGLCGASAMVRAYDEGTQHWTNWRTFSIDC